MKGFRINRSSDGNEPKETNVLNCRDFLKTVGSATTGMYVMGGVAAFVSLQVGPERRQVIVGGRRIKVIDMHAQC